MTVHKSTAQFAKDHSEAPPKAADTFNRLTVKPLTGAMGAELSGADLNNLDDQTFSEIVKALYDFGVIAFRDQNLAPETHKAFASRFGRLEVHPIVEGVEGHPEMIKMHKSANTESTFGVGWHSDNSFLENPSLGSIVYGDVIPPVGGDTLFANQYLAYETLSPGMKKMIASVNAVHSARDAYTSPTANEKYDGKGTIKYRHAEIIEHEVEHPVVRTHPATGRKALYVNPMFTLRFADMTREESAPLLEYLLRHCVREDFQCRVRWAKGTVTMWDNRCVQHAALNDCEGYERILYRVTIAGERPE